MRCRSILKILTELRTYYKRGNVVIPDEWKILPCQNWPKKVMVPDKVKMNADAFVKYVLSKMVRYDFPRLYGDQKKNVILHLDNAPAHTAETTVDWMKKRNVKWIPEDI